VSCDHSEELLHAYLDGETDLTLGAGIERSLRECPQCSRSFLNHQKLRSAMRSGSLAFSAPKALRARVRRALRDERREHLPRWSISRLWIAIAVPAAAVFVVALLLLRPAAGPGPADDLLVQELVADHIRSQMADHLTDVASTNQHTVKPWFDGRLDFSPEVRDLAEQGYPLVGGRLDYAGNRALAALVYRRRQHVINLFVWPAADGGATAVLEASRRGYNVIRWSRSGFVLTAVSDLNTAELRAFVEEMRQ